LALPSYRLHLLARIELERAFPELRGTEWTIRSPFDRGYNCHAWAVCETRVRWEPSPDDYWPPGLRNGDISDYNLDNFVRAYTCVGFRECLDDRFEFGFQKIAIYSEENLGEEWPQHTARQTLFGRTWLSKLGDHEDICHQSADHLEGQQYGRVVKYMKRNWLRALMEPTSVWIRATIQHFWYRRCHPLGT